MEKVVRHTKKVLIGIIGGLVFLIGIILIPYPGPGWLIVFAGLAILATEFEFAERFLHKLRVKYDAWVEWLKRQSRWVQVSVLAMTALVVVTTVWFMNGFGLINNFLNLGQEWAVSPFFK